MSFMQETDRWLEEILPDVPAVKRPEVKAAIKRALLASYRNGQDSALKAARANRKGQGSTRS